MARQGKIYRSTLVFCAFYPNIAAMSGDDLVGIIEAEADTNRVPAPVCGKSLEYLPDIRFCKSQSVVLNAENHMVFDVDAFFH